MKKYEGFDLIAPFYDSLARLVFGNALKNAQREFISHIPDHARVLIIGGGSGWQLIELLKRKPFCKIVYVEASSKMLRLAQKKLQKNKFQDLANIQLLLDRHYIENGKQEFDVIITSFFLDVFNKPTLEKNISLLNNLLKPGGLWLIADFDNKECERSLLKKLLLRLMYVFFRLTTRLEVKELYDFESLFKMEKLLVMDSKSFYSGMIFSTLYQKPSLT